jgi:hypothetical protein
MWVTQYKSHTTKDKRKGGKRNHAYTKKDLRAMIKCKKEEIKLLGVMHSRRLKRDLERDINMIQAEIDQMGTAYGSGHATYKCTKTRAGATPSTMHSVSSPCNEPVVHGQPTILKKMCSVSATRGGKVMVLYLASGDKCDDCDQMMQMIVSESMLCCPVCGKMTPYLDSTSSSTAYGEEVEFSSFSYKRSNHFQEWLNSFQAKETTDIPQEVYDKVMEELYRQRITDIQKITSKKVREVLKDLKYRKYYEHVTQISCRLTGRMPPRMTSQQEEQCRLMFMAIQGPFEKHCPKDRKNFLSYSYCLYKFCELMGYNEFLPCFSLLKGRDKLFKQDTIFKKICEELNWEFVPSI